MNEERKKKQNYCQKISSEISEGAPGQGGWGAKLHSAQYFWSIKLHIHWRRRCENFEKYFFSKKVLIKSNKINFRGYGLKIFEMFFNKKQLYRSFKSELDPNLQINLQISKSKCLKSINSKLFWSDKHWFFPKNFRFYENISKFLHFSNKWGPIKLHTAKFVMKNAIKEDAWATIKLHVKLLVKL